jgi:hypothetical protein
VPGVTGFEFRGFIRKERNRNYLTDLEPETWNLEPATWNRLVPYRDHIMNELKTDLISESIEIGHIEVPGKG